MNNIHTCESTNLKYLKSDNKSDKAIFILHGYGASMHDLAGLSPMLDPKGGYTWFFIDGPLGVDIGMHVEGRAWFPIDMQELQMAMMTGTHRSFADKNPPGFEESLKLVKDFISIHSEKSDSIIIGGFSQGSMVTSHLLDKFKKLVGYICLSGTLINLDGLESVLDKSSGINFFQSHGKGDPVLDYAQAMNFFEFLKLNRLQGEFISFDGGHEIPPKVIEKCREFLSRLAES